MMADWQDFVVPRSREERAMEALRARLPNMTPAEEARCRRFVRGDGGFLAIRALAFVTSDLARMLGEPGR